MCGGANGQQDHSLYSFLTIKFSGLFRQLSHDATALELAHAVDASRCLSLEVQQTGYLGRRDACSLRGRRRDALAPL